MYLHKCNVSLNFFFCLLSQLYIAFCCDFLCPNNDICLQIMRIGTLLLKPNHEFRDKITSTIKSILLGVNKEIFNSKNCFNSIIPLQKGIKKELGVKFVAKS